MMMIWSSPNLPRKSFWWAKTKCHLRIYCKQKDQLVFGFLWFSYFYFREKSMPCFVQATLVACFQLNCISVWRLTLHAAYMYVHGTSRKMESGDTGNALELFWVIDSIIEPNRVQSFKYLLCLEHHVHIKG